MNLFDKNISEFFVKGDFPKQVKDVNGNILCKIKHGWSRYRKNTVIDVENNVLFTFQEQKKSLFRDWGSQFYEIKNDVNNVTGKVSKKREQHTIDFLLTTLDGGIVLTTKMPYFEEPYEIKDVKGNVIATVNKTTENFVQDLFGKKRHIRIEELSYDRIILLGFLLSIFHALTEWGGGGS